MSENSFRSRRALLTGAAAAGAAVAANAVVAATPALAVGDPLILSADNPTTAATTVTATADAAVAFGATNTLATGTGVFGSVGTLPDGYDLSYTGTFGYSPAGTQDVLAAGVWGSSDDAGVYGDGGSYGVYGESSGGIGAYGYSDSGPGVVGESSTGPGVVGESSTGSGVIASSTGGLALQVYGRMRLENNRQGKASVSAGKSSWSKTITGIASGNVVIAVLQSSETGVWVRAAVASSGKITVYFNKALPTSATIGWIVFG